MALAYRELPDRLRAPLIRALLQPWPEMARATVYFSFYVIDALLSAGHINAVETRWDFWRQLESKGLCTTLEAPEPARSDCHAWGAHPLFHSLAGKTGIQPEAPGFTRVRINPQLGASTQLSAKVPHPKGHIRVDCTFLADHFHVLVDSPVDGSLHWHGQTFPFAAGRALEWRFDASN